jgi:hypothetical protein
MRADVISGNDRRQGRLTWKTISWAIVGLLSIGLIGLIPLVAGSKPEPREIRLVARNMTFYLDGESAPNPTLKVKAGEEIRIVLRNEEPGMTHDFAVASLSVGVEPLRGLGVVSLVFRAPAQPGSHEYVCTPHSMMMRGTLLVEN